MVLGHARTRKSPQTYVLHRRALVRSFFPAPFRPRHNLHIAIGRITSPCKSELSRPLLALARSALQRFPDPDLGSG